MFEWANGQRLFPMVELDRTDPDKESMSAIRDDLCTEWSPGNQRWSSVLSDDLQFQIDICRQSHRIAARSGCRCCRNTRP